MTESAKYAQERYNQHASVIIVGIDVLARERRIDKAVRRCVNVDDLAWWFKEMKPDAGLEVWPATVEAIRAEYHRIVAEERD
jgi:hypothetical protein